MKVRKSDHEMARKKVKSRPSARQAFRAIISRINWLDDKVQIRNANGQPHDLYIDEREALLWVLDKIASLSRNLVSRDEVIRELLINRRCACGGWSCPRCLVTIEEAEKIVPDLRDNIDRERGERRYPL